jgi:hypothetical protein
MFATVETWPFEIPLGAENPTPHKLIVQNFVNAILKDEPLIAPRGGREGPGARQRDADGGTDP